MQDTFRGQFTVKLDDKARLTWPSQWKSLIHNNLTKSAVTTVITNCVVDGLCFLDVYTYQAWMDLEERVARLPQLKSEVQLFRRFYLSAAQVVDMDKSSRLLIPQTLRRFANLQGEVVLVGMGQKFEIWGMENWQTHHTRMCDGFAASQQVLVDLEAA